MANESAVTGSYQGVVRWWTISLCLALSISIGCLLASGLLLLVVGATSIVVATALAFRWPMAAALSVLLVSGGYSIFTMVPGWDIKGTTVGASVRIEDVLMLGMLAAGLIRLASLAGRKRAGKLLVPFLLLGMWLAYETLRNVAIAGLSAPGELRFFYLLLAVAFCLAVSIDRESMVRTGLRGFALVTVALPVVLFPAVVYLKGWSLGPASRVFPANVSLGLLLGLAVLWQCRAFVRWPRIAIYAATLFGVVEILLDAHRSVWLSAIVLLGLLLARQKAAGRARWVFLGVVIATAAIFAAQALGYDVLSIVAARGSAALTEQDTAGIRMSMWRAAAPLIEASPVIGRGLGLYWNLYLPDAGYSVSVFPHSLYVMVLADLGVVGMVLLAWLWLRSWMVFVSIPRIAGRAITRQLLRPACASLGLGALGAIAAYGVAYGFEPYSVTLVGICYGGATLATWQDEPPEIADRLD